LDFQQKEGVMKNIQKCALLQGIPESDIQSLLTCLGGKTQNFKKDEFLYRAEDKPGAVGVVLEGTVHIITEDFWGNRSLLSEADEGATFAEAFACAETDALPVSVVAAKDTEVLWLNYRRIITSCTSACLFHAKLIENMLKILAQKNIFMLKKLEHVTRRTTREKLLSYLSEQVKHSGNNCVDIPFDRQQLADYLAVERSAMSAELSKMRKDGLLKFQKNHFTLYP